MSEGELWIMKFAWVTLGELVEFTAFRALLCFTKTEDEAKLVEIKVVDSSIKIICWFMLIMLRIKVRRDGPSRRLVHHKLVATRVAKFLAAPFGNVWPWSGVKFIHKTIHNSKSILDLWKRVFFTLNTRKEFPCGSAPKASFHQRNV